MSDRNDELEQIRNKLLSMSFEKAWTLKEQAGYQYGEDARDQVRFG